MDLTPPQSGPNEPSPFIVVLQQQDPLPSGYFVPAAVVQLTPGLRTSGLLRGLPAEEVKTLLLLLTYLTPNGGFLATVPQMAEAMRVSSGKMEQRLKRLQDFTWQGAPLLREQVRESGLRSYLPSPFLIQVEQAAPPPAAETIAPATHVNSRAAVITHSRAAYAHPRDAVERQIAQLNGWELPGETGMESEEVTLRRRLLRFGISPEVTEELLVQYPTEEIARQLEWLPYRKARKPGPLLVAAIENHYDEPAVLRSRRRLDHAVQDDTDDSGTEGSADGSPTVPSPPVDAFAAGASLILPPELPHDAQAEDEISPTV